MNPYAVNKVTRHPHVIRALLDRESHHCSPILMHLMPTNACQHHCLFCSYRLENWKNSEAFKRGSSLVWEKCRELLLDFESIGGRAVEITGGGEPLFYTHIERVFEHLAKTALDVSLVTNGTLLTDKRAELLMACSLQWARVSIDAGTQETYCRIRHADSQDWRKAWDAVSRLSRLMDRNKGQRLGIGFVVNDSNFMELAKFVHLASESGADNVRISMAFTPAGATLLAPDQIKWTLEQLEYARVYARPDFHVHDLFAERLDNLRNPAQNMGYCPSKDVLCVVEGSGEVYTCCTLAGSNSGKMGNIYERRFAELWPAQAEWRKNFPSDKLCSKLACLYAERNRVMNALREPGLHANFI